MKQGVYFTTPVATLKKQGKAITGLALPYFDKGQAPHSIYFKTGALVNYDYPLPLALEHDVRKKVGTVHKIWESAEGVNFIATLDEGIDVNTLPPHLSIGGDAFLTAEGEATALYIKEISLTDTPAYTATRYEIAATNKPQQHMDTNEIKMTLEKAKEAFKKLKFQETPENQGAAPSPEVMAEMDERLSALEEAVKSLMSQLQQLQESLGLVVEAAAGLTSEAETVKASAVDAAEKKAAELLATANERLDKVDELLNLIKNLSNGK